MAPLLLLLRPPIPRKRVVLSAAINSQATTTIKSVEQGPPAHFWSDPAEDGISTKIVPARPCSTAARETDGTTTCVDTAADIEAALRVPRLLILQKLLTSLDATDVLIGKNRQ